MSQHFKQILFIQIQISLAGLIMLSFTGCTSDKAIQPVNLIQTSQIFEPGDTNQIGLADLDGDGDLDAVFSNQADHHCRVLWNDGAGHFTDSGQRLTQQGHGVGIGDLDGDSDLDLFITCAGWRKEKGVFRSLPSRIYFNNGQGVFADSGQDLGDTVPSGNGINLLDFDGDNDLDAHIFYYTTQAAPYYHHLYLNDGKGLFQDSGITLPEGSYIVWGDLNTDGAVDIFMMEWEKGLRVLLNNGSSDFEEIWAESDPSLLYGDTVLGDIDGDGDLDAVVTPRGSQENKPARVLLNDSKGRFEGKEVLSFQPAKADSAFLGDLNGDGRLDAFLTGFKGVNQLWLNDGTGRFIDSGLRMCEGDPNAHAALGDLDGDGDLDVFISFYGKGSNSVWLNQ